MNQHFDNIEIRVMTGTVEEFRKACLIMTFAVDRVCPASGGARGEVGGARWCGHTGRPPAVAAFRPGYDICGRLTKVQTARFLTLKNAQNYVTSQRGYDRAKLCGSHYLPRWKARAATVHPAGETEGAWRYCLSYRLLLSQTDDGDHGVMM